MLKKLNEAMNSLKEFTTINKYNDAKGVRKLLQTIKTEAQLIRKEVLENWKANKKVELQSEEPAQVDTEEEDDDEYMEKQ